jgi:hypothetical protein
MLPLPQPSRRTVLRIGTAGALDWLLPRSWNASLQAQSPSGLIEVPTKGRIYVNCVLCYKPQGKEKEQVHHNVIIAIDPTIGKWQTITENGYAGRVSPNRHALAFRREQGPWG